MPPAGWGWAPAVRGSGPPRPVVGVSPAAGDKPQPYIRTAALPPAVHIGRWLLFRWRLGMRAGGAGVPALPRPVVGVSPAAGDKPQPYIRSAALPPAAGDGRRRCRGRRCRRRCRVPALHVRWAVFRRRRGTSPSPTLGRRSLFRRRCRVPASHVRWSVFRRRRGTSPSPTLGRRCRRRRGMSAGGVGFRPSRVRWSVFRRRRGMRAGHTGGGVAAGGGGGVPAIQGAALPPAICFRTIVWQFRSSRLM